MLLSAIAATTLFVSSCGGDGESTQAVMTEFAFAPTTWTVPAGTEVTVELVNNGTVEHNWAVLTAGSEISSEGDLPQDPAARDALYLVKGSAAPGETTSITFTAPDPGEYQVICDIQAHFSAGMRGTLIVDG